MAKYALFANSVFYAEGGAKDFVSFGDSLGFLMKFHSEMKPLSCTWAHIVDVETMKIIFEWSSSDCNGDEPEVWKAPE